MIRRLFLAVGLGLVLGREARGVNLVPLNAPQQWSPLEFRVEGVPTATRPFDPLNIAIDATFALPDGKGLTVPGFWFQGYRRTLAQGTEKLTVEQAPEWRVRFAPPVAGHYSVHVTVRENGQVSGQPGVSQFDVAAAGPGAHTLPVRIAPNRQYFERVDGTALPLVGANVCWPGARGTFDYDDWFGAMAAAGENCARIWMAPWAFGIEAEPGTLTQYRLDRAWQLDYVVRLAEAKGIYLILCLDFHGMFEVTPDAWGGNNFWPKNPYNAALGGPSANQNAFFTDPDAQQIYQKRLRYLVGRYGSSPSLLAWEFFNEIDNVYSHLKPSDVAQWHATMADWLHAHDPFQHPVTTSFGSAGDRPEIWNLPGLDLVTYHSYNLPKPATGLASAVESLRSRYRKPVLIEEYGVDWRGWGDTLDPHERALRQALWSGALNGSAGASMSWWWEKLHSENVYPLFSALNGFLEQTRLGKNGWSALRFRTAGEPPASVGSGPTNAPEFTAQLILNNQWGAKLRGQMAVPNALSAMSASDFLNSFVHGSGHPDLRIPLKISARLGEGAQLVLHLNSVSDGAVMSVLVDGAEKLRRSLVNKDHGYQVNNEYNEDFTLALPAGPHLIEIRNPGGDWYYLDWIRLDHAVVSEYAGNWQPSPAAVGVQSTNQALLYVINPAAEYPVNATAAEIDLLTNGLVTLTNLPPGQYTADWADPRTGAALGSTKGRWEGASFVLPLPPFREDLAARLTRELVFRRVEKEANGAARLELEGAAGQSAQIEGSADLGTWIPLGSVENRDGTVSFEDSGAGENDWRFYRARLRE